MIEARFAPQLQVLQTAGETAHQCLDIAYLIGTIEVAKIGGRKRFLAARAVPFGTAIVLARGSVTGGGNGRLNVGVAQCACPLGRPGLHDTVICKSLLVRSQEVSIEQRIESPPFVAATTQQRLEAPTQNLAVENPDLLGRFEHARRIAAAYAKSVGAKKPGKAGQSRAQGRARIGIQQRRDNQHAAALRASTSRVSRPRSSRVLTRALSVSRMRSAPSSSIAVTPSRSSAAVQSSVSAMPGFFCRSIRRTLCTNSTSWRANCPAASGARNSTIASSFSKSG